MAGRGVPGALTALAAALLVAGCAGSPVHRVAADSPAVIKYKTAFAADRERLDTALDALLRCAGDGDCAEAANRLELATTALGDLYYFDSPERVLTPQPLPECLRPADRHVGVAVGFLRAAASGRGKPPASALAARSELAAAASLLAAAHC